MNYFVFHVTAALSQTVDRIRVLAASLEEATATVEAARLDGERFHRIRFEHVER